MDPPPLESFAMPSNLIEEHAATLHSDPPPQASPISVSPARIPKKIQPPQIEKTVSTDLKSPMLSPRDQNGGTRSGSFEIGGGAPDDNIHSLGLPDGIQLPATVTPGMIDGRLRRAFLELTPVQMREVLEEYDVAVKDKGGEIRNKTAYFFGVVKRYKTMAQEGLNPSVSKQGTLSDKVLMRLDALVASGFCTTDDLDMKIKDRMRMLTEIDALDAIDEINGCQRGSIRNFASYFMGIMNRYMKGERRDPLTRGSNRVHEHKRQQDLPGMNDPRFSHYGSASHQPVKRGGDRDRRSSRDGDRDRRIRSRRSRSRSRSYDSRSRSRSPDYRRRRHSRSGSRDRHRSRRHAEPTRDPHSISSSLPVVKSYSNQPLMMNGLPPPPPPPPPRPPQTVMQPMAQQLLPGQQPQMIMPGFQSQMQPPQQGGFQGFMQPISQIPQPGQGAMSVQMQQQFQQLQQQQQLLQQYMRQAPGINMQQQSMQQMMQGIMPGSQVAITNGLLLGQPAHQSVNAQNNFALQNAMQQGQNQGQPQLDLFKLADQASQALSGRFPLTIAPAPMSNPNFPPVPASAPSHGNSYQQNHEVNEKELPMMVQYALQNLRVTGHIESSSLDTPLCGMLHRLPENAALKALGVYSACDLGKMRNKGAYFSSILKKELIKLGL